MALIYVLCYHNIDSNYCYLIKQVFCAPLSTLPQNYVFMSFSYGYGVVALALCVFGLFLLVKMGYHFIWLC